MQNLMTKSERTRLKFRMMRDKDILIRPVADSVRIYKAPPALVKAARRAAFNDLIIDKGIDEVIKVGKERASRRYFFRLVKQELKYPGLLERIAEIQPQRGVRGTVTFSNLAKEVKLTKQRISQVYQTLQDAAIAMEVKSLRALVKEIKKHVKSPKRGK